MPRKDGMHVGVECCLHSDEGMECREVSEHQLQGYFLSPSISSVQIQFARYPIGLPAPCPI